MRTLMFSLVFILVFQIATAEENQSKNPSVENTISQKSPALEPKKWKASWDSFLFDFEGRRASKTDEYSFGDVKLNMQIFSLNYQPSFDWNYTALVPHLQNQVVTYFYGVPYKDQSSGIGDTSLIASHFLGTNDGYMGFVDFGLNLPTGGISERNQNNPSFNYPYNMQLGSGTVDPTLGLMLLYVVPEFTLGTRASGVFRTGQLNSQNYHLGNLYRLDYWGQYSITSNLQAKISGYHKNKEAISGADKTLGRNSLLEFYHHNQVDWNTSVGLSFNHAIGSGAAFAAEFALPVMQGSQNWDDVSVETEYWAKAQVSGTF